MSTCLSSIPRAEREIVLTHATVLQNKGQSSKESTEIESPSDELNCPFVTTNNPRIHSATQCPNINGSISLPHESLAQIQTIQETPNAATSIYDLESPNLDYYHAVQWFKSLLGMAIIIILNFSMGLLRVLGNGYSIVNAVVLLLLLLAVIPTYILWIYTLLALSMDAFPSLSSSRKQKKTLHICLIAVLMLGILGGSWYDPFPLLPNFYGILPTQWITILASITLYIGFCILKSNKPTADSAG